MENSVVVLRVVVDVTDCHQFLMSCGAVRRVRGFCLLGYDTFNLPGRGVTNLLQEHPAASLILEGGGK